MTFHIPAGLPQEIRNDLERACIGGGQDAMPFATQVQLDGDKLTLRRRGDESGFLIAPWDIPGFGRIMHCSATLMERTPAYHLTTELARGRTNRMRSQSFDWIQSGLDVDQALLGRIEESVHRFGQALFPPAPEARHEHAVQALILGCQASQDLVDAYVKQVFHLRHLTQPRIDTWLSCRLNGWPLRPDLQKVLPLACNALGVGIPWRDIEPSKGDYRWHSMDDMLAWAEKTGLTVIGGPLIDFSGFGLPDWIWGKHTRLESLAEHMCDFVDKVIRRYPARVRLWQLTAGSNVAGVVGRGEEELLWLTYQILQAGRRAGEALDLIIGLAQPWGDYLAEQECKLSPFGFADSLIRTGIKLAGLDLEVIMGISSRGSYCRDPFDLSRLIDLYSYLEVPLQLTLGYPSSAQPDRLAEPDLRVDAGCWRGPYSPQVQAEWAQRFTALALCKPTVRGIQWVNLNDAAEHAYPHCGLVDAQGNIKPSMDQLMELRNAHLR